MDSVGTLNALITENQERIRSYLAQKERLDFQIKQLETVNEHAKAIINIWQGTHPHTPNAPGTPESTKVSPARLREIVVKILEQEGKPLSTGDLWEKFTNLGYETDAQNPRSAFSAYIANTQRMKHPPIFKIDSDKWGLLEWKIVSDQDSAPEKKKNEDASQSDQEPEASSGSDSSTTTQKEDAEPRMF